MDFSTALEWLKQGLKVKLSPWGGYWELKDGNVIMYCKNGDVLDLRETKDTLFTLSNIATKDWQIADSSNCKLLEQIQVK